MTVLLPIVAEENNLATFQECLRLLHWGIIQTQDNWDK